MFRQSIVDTVIHVVVRVYSPLSSSYVSTESPEYYLSRRPTAHRARTLVPFSRSKHWITLRGRYCSTKRKEALYVLNNGAGPRAARETFHNALPRKRRQRWQLHGRKRGCKKERRDLAAPIVLFGTRARYTDLR